MLIFMPCEVAMCFTDDKTGINRLSVATGLTSPIHHSIQYLQCEEKIE
jgi:hypothetical protein